MTEFSIPANELARLTSNALAFMPARSAVKVCRVWADQGTLAITATDLFTVGRDSTTIVAEPAGVLPPAVSIDLKREDLQDLDRLARARKKDTLRLKIIHEDGLSVWSDTNLWVSFLDSSELRSPENLWDICDELLRRPAPDHLALIDPKFMNPFGKIKTSGAAETIADLSIGESGSQIHVKIGSTFRGAIMPVDREEAEASEQIGPDGMWV